MSLEDELSSENFSVSKFMKSGLKGGEDLRKLREKRSDIQKLSEESSSLIRKNVFKNYTQFIDTAKEIQYLETGMYNLSHLLTEQKNLIEQMMDMPFAGTTKDLNRPNSKVASSFTNKKKSLQGVLEKVDGASHMMDNPNRYLVLESDLTELNQENARPIRTVRAFLLSDGLMITTWIPHKLGTIRYKLESLFALDNLALLNQKDGDVVRNAFKLLVFPEHKLFACENPRLKRKWLDCFEITKNTMLQQGSLVRQATIRTKRAMSVGNEDAAFQSPAPVAPQNLSEDGLAELEWFKELPDELDVCIAQRDFETAVDLLFEGRDSLGECPDRVVAREIGEKLAQKDRQLVEVLSRELKVSAEKSLQGGPKATRRAISLLIKLGKSSQACDLYLKNRTALIKHVTKELKIADDPISYLRQLTKIVFGNLNDVARGFVGLFGENSGCCSVLLLWGGGELRNYVNLVLRHVFDPGPSLAVIGQAVRIVINHCEQLALLGLDFTFEIEKLMAPSVQRLLQDNNQNLTEATKLRMAEEKWKLHNLQSESNLSKFLEEMQDFGLRLDAYVCERCRLWLTLQVCHFARASLQLARDVAPLRLCEEVRPICDDIILELWRLELSHIRLGLSAKGRPPQQKTVAEHCARFIVGQLLPLCEDAYITGSKHTDWTPLQTLLAKDFPMLVSYRTAATRHFEDLVEV